MLLADYRPYADCQTAAGRAFLQTECWTRMSILNTARCGFFSSGRAVWEYCEDIWRARLVPTVPWGGTPRVPAAPVGSVRGLGRLCGQGA